MKVNNSRNYIAFKDAFKEKLASILDGF